MLDRYTRKNRALAAVVAGVVGFSLVYGALSLIGRTPLPSAEASTLPTIPAGTGALTAVTVAATDSVVLSVTPTNHKGKPTNADVLWQSSDPSIAEIVPMGTSVLVRFVGTGTVTITATWNAGARQTGTKAFVLTVLPKTVSYTYQWLDSLADTLITGTTNRYRMQVDASSGERMDTATVVWQSTDPTVLQVQGDGASYINGESVFGVNVTALKPGTASISLVHSANGALLSPPQRVVVFPKVGGVETLLEDGSVVPDTLLVPEGGDMQLYLVVFDSTRTIFYIDPVPPASFPYQIGTKLPPE